jgi:hypothetical protein
MKTNRPILALLAGAAVALQLLLAAYSSQANTILASYYAGSNGVPAIAPNPLNVDGGSWTYIGGGATNPLYADTVIYTNLNPDPLFASLNCWRTLDNTNVSGGLYHITPSATDATNCFWNGFKLSGYMRMLDPVANNAGGITVYLRYASTNFNMQFSSYFDINATNALYMEPQTLVANIAVVSTSGPNVTNYHLYEIIYDPAEHTASYLCDGTVMKSNVAATVTGVTVDGTSFGTGSGSGKGDGYWNKVTLECFPYAKPTVTVNPTNALKRVGDPYTFVAAFTGSATALQWYKTDTGGNTAPINGANKRAYSIPYISLDSAGSYQLAIFDPVGGTNVYTTPATLTVSTDTNAPTVLTVTGSLTKQHVLVKWSEIPDSSSALNINNYKFQSNTLSVVNASLADATTVRLRTTPWTINTAFTIGISNVQDPSGNIMVGTNVTFTTPNLFPVCVYDAGSNSIVASAPDPTSTNGGSWRLTQTGSANTFANVSPDINGLNGWNITDLSAGPGGRLYYSYGFPQVSHGFTAANGWRLHARTRFLTDYDTANTLHLQYCDPAGKRYVLFWDFGGVNVDLYLMLNPNGANGGLLTNVTVNGVGASDYHDVEIVYNPTTQKGECYFDGEFLFGNWAGDASASFSGPYIGSVSDPAEGSMNFNQLDFSVVNAANPAFTEPATNIAVTAGTPVTLSRAYTGFLATCQWLKNATNAPGGTQATYSIASVSSADEGLYTLTTHNSWMQTESAAINLVIPPTISITRTNDNLVVTFTGTLQASDNISGTFTNVTPVPTSPLTLSNPADAGLFFRAAK